MNANKRAVIVGIFIFLGLAIFAAAVLTLGGQRKSFEKKITISAIFDDVGGLLTGNNVWFSGVKIGTVKNISFYGTSQVKVTMSVVQEAQEYIKQDALAKISTEGFIGNKIVVIYGGTKSAPAIDNGGMVTVKSAASTDEMLATLQENNKNILEITKDFKVITDRIVAGEGTLGKLMTDETLLNTLQSTATSLRQTSNNAEAFTSNLNSYTAKLQRKGTLANDLVSDTMIFNRLRSTVSQFQSAAEKANDATANLKSASSGINDPNTPIGALLNDRQAAADLKATLRNLQSGTDKLDDNMEALQHNILFRGFFKKRAKLEEKELKMQTDSTEVKVEIETER